MRNLFTNTIFTLGLLALTACGGGGSSTPTVTAPTINTFTASATTVDNGQPVTLAWTLGGSAPTSVKVDNTTLSATATSTTVTPKARQTYTLTVTNSAGTVSKAVSVVSKGVTAFSTSNIFVPNFMAKDPSGNIYVVEVGVSGSIHKVTPAGVVSTFSNTPACTGLAWSSFHNALLAVNPWGLVQFSASGVKSTLIANFPYNTFTVTKDGTVFAVNQNAFGHTITKIYPNGATATITGDAQFFPGNMILDATESNLYVVGGSSGSTMVTIDGIPAMVLTSSNLIYKIDLTTSLITVVAGQFNVDGHADGLGTAATFSNPDLATLSNDGTALYVTDINNGRIRKLILATGQVTTVAGSLTPQPYTGSTPFVAGTYAGAVFTPLGIVQNANGDLVFAQAASTNGIIVATPICVVTL